MSIARSPHPFTPSPKPRLISPHVNRTLAAPVHTFGRATIDIAPRQSHARRTRSRGGRGRDGSHPMSHVGATCQTSATPSPPTARARWRHPHRAGACRSTRRHTTTMNLHTRSPGWSARRPQPPRLDVIPPGLPPQRSALRTIPSCRNFRATRQQRRAAPRYAAETPRSAACSRAASLAARRRAQCVRATQTNRIES